MQIKSLRLAKGWSQEQLASNAQLSVRTIQRIENGGNISINTLNALSTALNTPLVNIYAKQCTDLTTDKASRLTFLDNLRAFLVFLVVLYHSGMVYESSGIGAYFWLVDDQQTNDLSGIINLVIDIFVMSALFFISGVFTPLSAKKHSTGAFLRAKTKRLLLPWLIAVTILMPLYKMIFLASRGLPQQEWQSYLYFSNGLFSQSWLWFLPVLFLFNVIYLVASTVRRYFQISLRHFTLTHVILITFTLGLLYTFIMRFFGFAGWSKSPLLDFQNERLLVYLLYFFVGVFFQHRQLFSQEWSTKKISLWVNFSAWLPINLYIALIIFTLIKPNSFIVSEAVDQLMLQVFFHLSLMALLYSAVVGFRRFFNRASALTRALSKNSYGVYIIHTIVLGVIAMLLQALVLPSLLKYVLLVNATYVVSQLLVSLYKFVSSPSH